MRLYNSLSRRVEVFEPLEAGHVRMYTCGPTVYDYAHVGNFRAYVFEDVLRRTLRRQGWRVTQVMNLTDVDDKTIRGARERGVSLAEFTQPYIHSFFEDLRALAIEPAEHYPRATDHVPEMIALIRRLFERGHAYLSDDGSVYFAVRSFPAYGRLAHLDPASLQPGARVAHDEYDKDHAADFALWKAWDESDGDVAWDSPWGRGRPGWHIECSAMSMKYLGETFDVHTGGADNLFPHHENEIAQSEGATGRPFVRFWLHCGYLVVEGQKMSKSLGNFYTLRDLQVRGFEGREVRYALLAAHYRQPLNFSLEALAAARSAVGRIDDFYARLASVAGHAVPCLDVAPAWAIQAHRRFWETMQEDLNTPDALATLFEMVRDGHRQMDAGALRAAEAAGVMTVLEDMDRVLGLAPRSEGQPDPEIERLVQAREAARTARRWEEADRLRAALRERGWEVRDTPEGPRLRRRPASSDPAESSR